MRRARMKRSEEESTEGGKGSAGRMLLRRTQYAVSMRTTERSERSHRVKGKEEQAERAEGTHRISFGIVGRRSHQADTYLDLLSGQDSAFLEIHTLTWVAPSFRLPPELAPIVLGSLCAGREMITDRGRESRVFGTCRRASSVHNACRRRSNASKTVRYRP